MEERWILAGKWGVWEGSGGVVLSGKSIVSASAHQRTNFIADSSIITTKKLRLVSELERNGDKFVAHLDKLLESEETKPVIIAFVHPKMDDLFSEARSRLQSCTTNFPLPISAPFFSIVKKYIPPGRLPR